MIAGNEPLMIAGTSGTQARPATFEGKGNGERISRRKRTTAQRKHVQKCRSESKYVDCMIL
eukprot:12066578-Heterocapsa_arctica.AAC.1